MAVNSIRTQGTRPAETHRCRDDALQQGERALGICRPWAASKTPDVVVWEHVGRVYSAPHPDNGKDLKAADNMSAAGHCQVSPHVPNGAAIFAPFLPP